MAMARLDKILVFTASTCGLGFGDLGVDGKEICLLAWQVINCAKTQAATPVEYCYIHPAESVPEGKTPIGIETKHLHKAPLISEGLKKVQSIFSSFPSNSVCLATNGPNPLRQCVFPEMARKGLPIPEFAYSFFDLRKEYGKRMNCDAADTLKDLCKNLGIDCPIGDVYGEEEIRVLACAVQEMLSQGHIFESPEVIMDSYRNSSNIDKNNVLDENVVKLRGIPFQASEKDVSHFLSGLNIIDGGIVFNINAVGRRTGECIVVFENEEQTLLAMKRNKHYLGKRYIEVYKSSADEFLEIAGGTCNAADGDQPFVVRLQGLPYRATEKDIVEFFGKDVSLKNGVDGVFIVCYPNGRASGDAFVLLDSDQDVSKIKQNNHGNDMMGRYIELFDSSLKEFLMVLRKSGSSVQLENFAYLDLGDSTNSKSTSSRGSERNCIKLRGLPWKSTAEDVIEFFSDISKHIQQHGVHMVLNARNHPTGDCYVEMDSVYSATKAAERLHKRHMGERYIEVFQCSGTEVTFALMDSAGHSHYVSNEKRSSTGTQVRAKGLAYSINEKQLVDFFKDFDIKHEDVELIQTQSGKSTGKANISFSSVDVAQRAVKELHMKYIGSRYVELFVM